MQSLTERQLDLYEECAAGGEYEAAYHALLSCLHLAEHAGDVGMVERLRGAVDKLDNFIEAVRPPHQLSRAQAEARGQQSLCASMRTHIDAVALRLRSVEQRSRQIRSAAAP